MEVKTLCVKGQIVASKGKMGGSLLGKLTVKKNRKLTTQSRGSRGNEVFSYLKTKVLIKNIGAGYKGTRGVLYKVELG